MGLTYASLFDGIGAAHAAWIPLGWRCLWTAEVEPFACRVVDARVGATNLGDVNEITREMLDAHPRPDVVVGGSPCQSFSVAGLRGGLADARGNLALRFMQLVGALRPRWVVWENVPGVLSVDGGRAFGAILGALDELGYGYAWSVLDAQWHGVAQRRRRVFVVGHLADWRPAAAVLLEPEGLSGDPPARGAPGQGAAADAGGGAAGASWWDGGQVTQTLDAVLAKGQTMPERNCFPAVLEPFVKAKRAQTSADEVAAFKASHFTRGKDGAPSPVVPPLSADADKGDQDVLIAHTSDGVVADPITAHEGKSWTNEGTTFRLRNCVQQAVGTDVYNGAITGEVAATMGTPGSSVNASGPTVMQSMAVRRLTPLECERLQGFPDGWTSVPHRGKPAADGPRYRAIGNSMAVPVMRWIGERIEKVELLLETVAHTGGMRTGAARQPSEEQPCTR